MDNFKSALKEIRWTLAQIMMFDILLSTLVVFLLFFLVLSTINLYPTAAFIIAAVFFIFKIATKSKVNKMRAVEDKYQFMQEKLRTAADNANLDNLVVNELKEDVIKDIGKVGVGGFINTKTLSLRIFLCIVLAFLIVFTSSMNLQFLDFENLIGAVPAMINGKTQNGEPGELIQDVNLTEDLYGDKKMAVLGNQAIDIKIKPAQFEVSVKDGGDAEAKQFDEIFPSDVEVGESEHYEERIPVEEQELVQNYFNKITEKS